MPTYEQRLLSWLQRHLVEQDSHIGEGGKHIHVEDIHFEQGQEKNLIVVVFREDRRPSCRFGFCMPVYEDDSQHGLLDVPDPTLWPDDPAIVWGDMVAASLTEQVVAGDRGLPEKCMDEGITWVSRLVPMHK